MAEGATAGPWPRDEQVLPPAIAAHRLLGNGSSSLLLTPLAEVDWWCAPDLDAAPLLWSLLDPAGGRAAFPDARPVEADEAPAGVTTTTTLSVAGTRIVVRDGLLPVEGGGSALVRLVRSLDGPAEIVHEVTMGGFDRPVAAWEGVDGHVGDLSVHVRGGTTTVDDDGVVRTRLAPDDGWSAIVISCTAPVAADADALAAALDQADAALAAARARTRLPRHHPERAADALAVIEACTFRETGAVVAAPTTSLPEAPGADRQFDYRFTWLRDASLAVSVASLLGHWDAAGRYLSFVHRLAEGGAVPKAPMSDIRGGDVPEERAVDGVAGWAGSLPVRVGNAAADQVQLDALGLLVEAISVHLQTGGALDRATWRLVRNVADQVAAGDDVMSNGIWELREPRPLVSADIGRWIALDRALWIARGWRPLTRRRRWKEARDATRDRVLAAVAEDGSLPESYGGDPGHLDASGLMAVLFGLVPPGDPRAAAIVDTTIAALGSGPFLYRYEPGGDDGFAGREGVFLPVSWWAAGALAKVGRLPEAVARVDAMCSALPRLLAEELDPATNASLGNVPLVWSHIEAARTMYLIDAEARRSRFGEAGLMAWRLARFASLRWGRGRDATTDPPLPVLPRATMPSA